MAPCIDHTLTIQFAGVVFTLLVCVTTPIIFIIDCTHVIVNMASSSQSDGGWHLEEVYHLCTSDKEEMAKGLRIEQQFQMLN
jgi:hypothetical protein